MTFDDFFEKATHSGPFPYQRRLAEEEQLPELVHAPTGAGKTAAAVIGWLWRYFHSGKPTPRRLVYCLPMWVLVEQTKDESQKWLANLGLDVGVHVLMGGEEKDDWDLEPERPAILIGTQDMLLSRALNRGYGMSRFRWPMHYALLNNDCLWILDEIQLMGVGLATSAQLQAFREKFRNFGQARTVWMSATLRPDWLATVDFHPRVPHLSTLDLNVQDYAASGLRERWVANKPITASGLAAVETNAIAKMLKEKHEDGSLTLVVVNTVDRGRALFGAIQTLYQPSKVKRVAKKEGLPTGSSESIPDIKLIHSRFRPMERENWMHWLKADPPANGRIVISTQVVEAGVDMSARILVTELAPWPSLVQRWGRCNRRGEFTNKNPAQIYWIDVPAEEDKEALPYSKSELDEARKQLKTMGDAGLKSLCDLFGALDEKDRAKLFPYDPPHVVRRKDFIDLFDTTPDLAGNDIDVSRFIREGHNLDVQVFWRTEEPPRVELEAKEARGIAPVREELCPVPVGAFREFVEKAKKLAFRWDALDGKWVKAGPDAVFPGQMFWIPQAQGGYSKSLGWDPKAPWADDLEIYNPPDEPVSKTAEPEYDSDLLSMFGWRSIAEHTGDVFEEIKAIIAKLPGEIPSGVLHVAGRWHDWGKAHAVFQDAVKDDSVGDAKRPGDWAGKRDIAKAAPKEFWRRYTRKHFRHELASALGVLSLLRSSKTPTDWASLSPHLQNLALYLIAAHHGKIRLSIRSMPDENKAKNADALFARGVWDSDPLPGVALGGDVVAPAVTLDLSPMQLGRGADGSPSWAERMLGLRNHADFGPLKLAFLEAILRAADMRASKKADEKAKVTSA